MADCKKSSFGQQVRLIMWTTPRSTSTVLTKCLSFVADCKVFFETYISAHHMGPDRILDEITDVNLNENVQSLKKSVIKETDTTGFDVSQCSFMWVKEQLEEAYNDKKFILCKDMAYAVTGRYAFLPKDYRHLFLIRHPLKVFPSWKKVFQFVMKMPLEEYQLDGLPHIMFPEGRGYKDMCELLEHLKETSDQDAIVIDADDLLRDPRGILSALFNAIGLPFEDKLLRWEAGDAVSREWVASNFLLQGNKIGHYYKTAFDSTCFLEPRALPDRSSLSADILRCVDASMPFYETMYTQRLKPTQLQD